MTVALLVLGLVLLGVGGELLVRGASRIAIAAGVTPLVVGLTVVAYGTSTPELVVSGYATVSGQADIAVANVIGSNVFNVLLILGMCAVLAPLTIHYQVLRREVPIMIGACLLLLLFGANGTVGLAEAGILLAGLAAYTGYTVVAARREAISAREERPAGAGAPRGWAGSLLLVAAGLAGLVVGARLAVDAAVEIARGLGVSEVVIGLTLVAAGTSLPEVATSVVATLRGQGDIAIGNVVGSNIYNVLAIVGLSGAIGGGALRVHPSLVAFDLPFMAAVAVATLPLFFTNRTLARWEGALFLAYYVAYAAYLVLRSTEHDALPQFSRIVWGFVLPITAVTVAVLALRAVRAERTRAAGASRG